MLDIDFFKNINDTYGHDIGDEVLRILAEIARKEMRHTDVLARFGGEEFIVILNSSSLEQAQTIVERCRQAIQQLDLRSDSGEKIQVTASFGITLSNIQLRPQQLLSQADKALYEAKACGRNQVKCYQDFFSEPKSC